MNPLCHIAVTRAVLDKNNFECDRNLVYAGCVLPDLAILRLIPWKPAHEDSLGFIHYLAEKDPEFLPLGFGFMLHGEKPCGLDSFAHGRGNFIDRAEMPVYNIVRKYKPKLFGDKLHLFIHSLIEYSCDTLVDRENAKILNRAFRALDTQRAAFHISNYFKGDGKKIERILRFFKGFDFEKMNSPARVARVWRSFQLYEMLGSGSLFQRYLRLTQSITLMKTRPLTKMILETRDVLRQPFEEFLKESTNGISISLSQSMIKKSFNAKRA